MKKIPTNKGKTYKTVKQDPRSIMFKAFYIDPTSYTFMNCLQSGLRAGYTQEYSENITALKPKWWVELIADNTVKRAQMLEKSEKHFDEMLDTPNGTEDRDRLKLKQKTAEFVSERIGKDVYSTRTEVTGADGKRLFSNEQRAAASIPLSKLFHSPVKGDT